MRTAPKPQRSPAEIAKVKGSDSVLDPMELANLGWLMASYTANPDEVLQQVDQQLFKLGLEVEQTDLGGDFYTWRIVPIST